VTSAGRAALWLLASWLLAAVALLAAQGRLVSLLAAGVPASVVALVLRALARQQRAPSICDRPSEDVAIPDHGLSCRLV
jgi:hypothetical protein